MFSQRKNDGQTLVFLLIMPYNVTMMITGGDVMVPEDIKIYHIVHISKLPSILHDGYLFSDALMTLHPPAGITIGMSKIKERRLSIPLASHKNLRVGECVPFYFCPRSVMLYMFYKGNHPDIEYKGGQEQIIHLVADFRATVDWAKSNNLRWAFTDSNAGSYYFDDYHSFNMLNRIDWSIVNAEQWGGKQDRKQAEFLIEKHFPWQLIENIGVYSFAQYEKVCEILHDDPKSVSVERLWYY